MKRRKRKIRIPTAQYGLNGSTLTTPEQQNMNYMQSLLNSTYQTPLQNYINNNGPISDQIQNLKAQGDINNSVNSARLDAISLANKTPNISGSIDVGGALSSASSLVNQGINAAQNSKHETVGQSIGSTATNALSMAATGAALGSAIPVIGTAAGAIIGAAAGVVSSGLTKGEKAKMTSFTEYDPGEQAGFFRPGRRRKINESREHVIRNAYDNRSAVRGTANLLADYNLKYGDMNTNTFAYGGMPSSLAYVDDGELINTPDGSITAVPEEGKPTDSNLVSLPTGSRILSDKLKVPGSNETFAEAGKKIMKRKKSLSNDVYAQNAAKLNEMNEQQAFDQLYDLQESVKAKRKIKPKSKAIPAYENGKEGDFRIGNTWYNVGDTVQYKGKNYIVTARNTMTPIDNPDMSASTKITRNGDGYWSRLWEGLKKLSNSYDGIDPNVILKATGNKGQLVLEKNIGAPAVDLVMEPIVDPVISLEPINTTTTTPYRRTVSKSITKTKPAVKASKPVTNSKSTIPTPPSVDLVMEPIQDIQLPELQPVLNFNTKSSGNDKNKDEYASVPKLKYDSNLLALLPIMDNLLTGKPEVADAVYNPYASAIMNTMRNRRFNIAAAMNDIRRNRATSNYNADQVNTNTGAGMAYRVASQRATDDAIQALRSQENNVNNAYLAEYANTANNLGQQWVQATNLANDINRRNRAQARNIRRAGLSGLSRWGQNETLMRNQARRDNAMMQLYAPLLQSGFNTEAYNNFINYLGGR